MNDCQHFRDGLCAISTHMAGMDVPAAEDACAACMKEPQPMQRNHVTCSKAIYTLIMSQKPVPPTLLAGVKKAPQQPAGGPGTELERLISWFKKKNGKCGCGNRIKKMNMWGPDKCEENMEIILGWLEGSAKTNKIPFSKTLAKVLVKKAIRNARKQKQ